MSGQGLDLFLTLEGGEGAGKSTQVRRLAERLEALGHDVVTTREPGGSPRAERIRHAILSGAVAPLGPRAEALMFAAARLDHVERTIGPALARGALVICDRFIDSTRAYQGALGRTDPALIAAMERVTVGRFAPNLTILLDLPPEIGMARAAARRRTDEAPDRFEREAGDFHRALRDAFLGIASREPERIHIVDASGPPEAVADAVWSALLARFPRIEDGPVCRSEEQ